LHLGLIAFLRAKAEYVKEIAGLLEGKRLVVTGIILAELLNFGIRTVLVNIRSEPFGPRPEDQGLLLGLSSGRRLKVHPALR